LFRWFFVGPVPLLYHTKRVARQYKVEMWLDLSFLLKELQVQDVQRDNGDPDQALRYVI